MELLTKVDIGTPHIAGYTLEGKARGTTQVFEPIASLLGMNNTLRWIRCCPRLSLPHYAAWSARSTDAEKAGAFGV